MSKANDTPVSASVDELLARIAELEAENASLKADLGGMAGWLVTAPNPNYSGNTAGINFRGGIAFIPEDVGAEKIARELGADFGYHVEHVDNWRSLPNAPEMKKSFIDVISGR